MLFANESDLPPHPCPLPQVKSVLEERGPIVAMLPQGGAGGSCRFTLWSAATCRRFPWARRVAPIQGGLVRLHSKEQPSAAPQFSVPFPLKPYLQTQARY